MQGTSVSFVPGQPRRRAPQVSRSHAERGNEKSRPVLRCIEGRFFTILGMSFMRNFFVLFALTAAIASQARSQANPSDMQFRLAESYEQSGDFESAVKIYQSIYAKDSSNMVVFEALRRDYMQLKRYDNAIALLERMIRKMPDNVTLLSSLASVYLLRSDEPR